MPSPDLLKQAFWGGRRGALLTSAQLGSYSADVVTFRVPASLHACLSVPHWAVTSQRTSALPGKVPGIYPALNEYFRYMHDYIMRQVVLLGDNLGRLLETGIHLSSKY